MAITATDKGTGSENSSNTSTVITMTSMTAGNVGILCFAMDNAGGTTTNFSATSYTDSVGNVWYLRTSATDGIANANVESGIFSSLLTSSTSSANSLTISYSNATVAKAWTWTEASTNVSGAQVLWAGANKSVTQASAGADTATPSLASTTVGPTDLIIGMVGAEQPDIFSAGDSDTTNGSWSTAQHTGIGTTTTGMSVYSQSKVANAYAGQTYNITLTTTASCRPATTIFTECDARARALSGGGTSEATTTITLVRGMATGSIGVLCLTADNAGSLGSAANIPAGTSVTDSKSNTWTQRTTGIIDVGAASTGVEIGIYTAPITTPLVIGDTISVPYISVNVAFKSYVVYEFAPSGSGSMSYVSSGVGTGINAGTSPTVTTGSITNGDYVIGMVGAEQIDGLTADADTTNGTWGQASALAVGTTQASSMAIIAQVKTVTATATQSYDVTTPAATDSIAGWVSIHDSSIGIPARQAAAFFQMF